MINIIRRSYQSINLLKKLDNKIDNKIDNKRYIKNKKKTTQKSIKLSSIDRNKKRATQLVLSYNESHMAVSILNAFVK